MARLLCMDAYTGADSISIYLSMPKSEVMTRGIVKDALSKGKQVYVPYLENERCIRKNGREGGVSRRYMEMVSLHSREDYRRCELNKDKWGIPSVTPGSIGHRIKMLDWQNSLSDWENGEVSDRDADLFALLKSRKEKSPQQPWLDTIIMPGLAFDRNCGRLGHGKGFYDTFLERYHATKRVKSDGTTKMPSLGM